MFHFVQVCNYFQMHLYSGITRGVLKWSCSRVSETLHQIISVSEAFLTQKQERVSSTWPFVIFFLQVTLK